MSDINITYYYVDRETCWVDIPKNTLTSQKRYNIGEYHVNVAHFSDIQDMVDFFVKQEANKMLEQTFANEYLATKKALELNQNMIKEYSEIITNSYDSYD